MNPSIVNPNKALWEKGDFTEIAAFMRQSGEAVVQSLKITPPLRVLDLGCGDGTTAIPLARTGAEVVGIDIARNLVEAAARAISTGKLNALPRLHTRPINVVVYHGSQGRTRFEVGFSLRCLQRLSRPHIATLHCRWRDNSSTRGASIPVLSY